jgi:protein Mpv17
MWLARSGLPHFLSHPSPTLANERTMFQRYDALLRRRPILVKTTTAVAIASVGDAAAQLYEKAGREEEEEEPFQWHRSLRMAGWVAATTPIQSAWFSALAARVPSPVVRVGLDQLLYAPVGLAGYLFFNAALGDRPGRGILDVDAGGTAVRQHLWAGLLANWMVWPAVQLFNFGLVQPRYQILVVNIAALGWSAFVSSLANRPSPAVAPFSPSEDLDGTLHAPVTVNTQPSPSEDLDGTLHAEEVLGVGAERGRHGHHHVLPLPLPLPTPSTEEERREAWRAEQARHVKLPMTQRLPVRPTAGPGTANPATWKEEPE